jgi:hypothetical protein
MKTLIISIITILLLNINWLYSQTWPKYFGQTNRYDYVADIIETYDKGYLICGYYSSPDWLQRWGWLIKTDVNGNIIWEKIIENTGKLFHPTAIEQTQDGGILVCGSSSHYDKSVPVVIKLNACGEKQWCKVFEGSPNYQSWANDIKETETGDIVVLVNMFGRNPHETIHLFKLSSEGGVLWKEPFATTFTYPNTNLKLGNSLLITNNGNYLISGDAYWEQPWNPGGPMPLTPLFIMASSDGNEEWVLPFGLNDTIIGEAFSTIEQVNDTYIGMAYYYGNTNIPLFAGFNGQGQETNLKYLNAQNIDPDLTSGTLQKMYSINSMHYAQGEFRYGPDQSIPVTVVELEDDIFGLDTIVANHAIQHGHFWPTNFNKAFNNKLLSTSTITPSSVNWDIALAKLNLNLEYDTAYTGNFTYDSLCIPGPPQSGFIYLNNCDIVLGTEMPTAGEYRNRVQHIPITIYPNPASDHITFALENTEHHRNIELRCYNLLGMQQHQTPLMRGQQQATISVSTWPPGMYAVVVYSDGRPVGRGKFVVQR